MCCGIKCARQTDLWCVNMSEEGEGRKCCWQRIVKQTAGCKSLFTNVKSIQFIQGDLQYGYVKYNKTTSMLKNLLVTFYKLQIYTKKQLT